MQRPFCSHCTGRARCQSHLLITTQWIVKHICKKCKRITKQHYSIKNYRQVASSFYCSAPRISDEDNIEDLEEVLKTFTNMCQEEIDVLNIKGCYPKSCIMH